MWHTVFPSERHIFLARSFWLFSFTFQSLHCSYSLAFNRRKSEFVSDPQTFISSCSCLLNDTLENRNRNRNRAAINLKSMYNHLKCLNPDVKWRAQTHFFSKCTFFFPLAVEATCIKHIYRNIYQWKQHYESKTLSALPTWESFVFSFTKTVKIFGQETEKAWAKQ